MKDKLFIIRKYVKAKSAVEAIRKEKKQEPDDVWIDDDWKRQEMNKNETRLEDSIGFVFNEYKEDDDREQTPKGKRKI